MTETDKIGHGYGPTYAELAVALGPRINMVEIGTADGDGLRWFRQIFSPATLAGVDLLPRDSAIAAADVHVQANQDDNRLPQYLEEASAGVVLWDLVVDDASHNDFFTTMTLLRMWPHVAPGGAYVIEDWNHAGMICGQLARELTSAFAESAEDRDMALSGLESITYRPGLIVIRKRADADHV